MKKTNYSYEKRQQELKKQKKRQEKLQRKQERKLNKLNGNEAPVEENAEETEEIESDS